MVQLLKLFYFLLFCFSASYLSTILWISDEFNNPYFEYILFNISSEKKDLDSFDNLIILKYIIYCLCYPILFSGFFVFLEKNLKYYSDNKVRSLAIRNFFNKFILYKLPIYLAVFATFFAFYKFGIFGYINNNYYNNSDYIKENYIDPKSIKILNRTKPKNLILIYVEGLDRSYGDLDVYKEDLLEELKKHEKLKFNQYIQVPGTEMTMAAIVATQCGIPLKIISILFDQHTQNNYLKFFLTKAKCLGQSLKDLGYNNIFLGGARLSFANKDNFLKSHGYDETYGLKYWLNSGRYTRSNMHGWGLHDKDLFVEAKRKLDELMQKKNLFNLTILTLDTHGPDFPDRFCKKNSTIKDVIRCSTNQIADFIQYIKDKDYLDNTNIVVIGDHLGIMASERIIKLKDRTIYNSWISKDEFPKNRNQIVAFDIAPSIIEFIGFDIEGDRYGLGYSAFFNKPKNFDENIINDIKKNVLNRSNFYTDLWKKED